MPTIRHFTDLEAWKTGHAIVLMVYTLTKKFPREEVFGLSAQLRRAAISIISNIAEGFSRRSSKEKQQFYHMSLGSLYEVECQAIVAKDLKYIDEKEYAALLVLCNQESRLLHGLIKSASERSSI